MSDLGKILLSYLEEYEQDWVGKEYVWMTAQAYVRARLENQFNEALNEALMYAETNGGLS